MEFDLITNVLTVYGPLGGGWIVAWVLWKRAERRETRTEKREDILREGLQNSTAAMNTLAERLSTVLITRMD